MTPHEVKVLIEDINDTCCIAQIPATYSYNEKSKSFECSSERIPNQMLISITCGLSES